MCSYNDRIQADHTFGATTCPKCEGTKRITLADRRDDELVDVRVTCLACDGLGVVHGS